MQTSKNKNPDVTIIREELSPTIPFPSLQAQDVLKAIGDATEPFCKSADNAIAKNGESNARTNEALDKDVDAIYRLADKAETAEEREALVNSARKLQKERVEVNEKHEAQNAEIIGSLAKVMKYVSRVVIALAGFSCFKYWVDKKYR